MTDEPKCRVCNRSGTWVAWSVFDGEVRCINCLGLDPLEAQLKNEACNRAMDAAFERGYEEWEQEEAAKGKKATG